MVEREIRTPVLESMESQRNSRSRCTNCEVSANPVDLQSSDMHSSTRSLSFTGFAGILKKVERLLKVKLKLYGETLVQRRNYSQFLPNTVNTGGAGSRI